MTKQEKLLNEEMLQSLPMIMYHGTNRKVINKENFYSEIKVFTCEKEYNDSLVIDRITKRRKPRYGRSNLDCAYHGFYMTPNFDKAKNRAGDNGMVLEIEINKKELLNSNIISLCVPNYEWAKFIINNRKKDTKTNLYDASYCFEMDGIAIELTNMIQKANINKINTNLYKSMLPDEIVDKCLYSNLSININKFKETSYYKKLKGFQLCISNPKLLKYLNIISIINIQGGLIYVTK